jgi:hypothetical protein
MALSIDQTSRDDHDRTIVLNLSNGGNPVPETPSSGKSAMPEAPKAVATPAHEQTVILDFSRRSSEILDPNTGNAHDRTVILDLSKTDSKPENPPVREVTVEELVETPVIPEVLDDDYRDSGTWVRWVGMKLLGENKANPDAERTKYSRLVMGALTDPSDETVFSALFDTTDAVRLKIRSEPKEYYRQVETILYKYLKEGKSFILGTEHVRKRFELAQAELTEYERKLSDGSMVITQEDVVMTRRRVEKYRELRMRLTPFVQAVSSRNPNNPYVIIAIRIAQLCGKLEERAKRMDEKAILEESPESKEIVETAEFGFMGRISRSLRSIFGRFGDKTPSKPETPNHTVQLAPLNHDATVILNPSSNLARKNT